MDPVLSSILFLTLLLVVGLAFFIRASTKDRTEVANFSAPIETVSLLNQLQDYFEARAYQITTLSPDKSEIIFSGMVRASAFMAIFLSALAGISLGCIALVLSILFPSNQSAYASLILLSPLAGLFYWKGATRPEVVQVTVTPAAQFPDRKQMPQTHVRISAHRDELAALQSKIDLKPLVTAS